MIKRSNFFLALVCVVISLSGCRSLIDGYVPRSFKKKLAVVPIVYSERAPYFLYDFEEDSISLESEPLQAEAAVPILENSATNNDSTLAESELDKFKTAVGDYWVYYDERSLSKCQQLDAELSDKLSNYSSFYNNQSRWEKFNSESKNSQSDSLKYYDFLLLKSEKENFGILSSVIIKERERVLSIYKKSLEICNGTEEFGYLSKRIESIEKSDSLASTTSNFQRNKFAERLWCKKNWEYINLIELYNFKCQESTQTKEQIAVEPVKAEVSTTKVDTTPESKAEEKKVDDVVSSEVSQPVQLPAVADKPAKSEVLAPTDGKKNVIEPKLNQLEISKTSSEPVVIENYYYPSGEVYSIQIGAFRGKADAIFYQKFSPVLKEELRDGLNRYTVGVFDSPASAKSALEVVKELGYKDAFIVVHIDGKRQIYNGR